LSQYKILQLSNKVIYPEIFKDMENIESNSFGSEYAQDAEDIEDDFTQPGFKGFGIFDSSEKIVGYVYGYSVTNDEIESLQFLVDSDVVWYDQNFKSEMNSLVSGNRIFKFLKGKLLKRQSFYVSNFAISNNSSKLYAKSILTSLFSHLKSSGVKYIVVNALSDTQKIFMDSTGKPKLNRFTDMKLKMLASIDTGSDTMGISYLL